MFKKNYDHLPKEIYFGMYREATRGNPNYFMTYGNGKSAARIQDNLRANGAHRWHNYMKTPKWDLNFVYSTDSFLVLWNSMAFHLFPYKSLSPIRKNKIKYLQELLFVYVGTNLLFPVSNAKK